MNVADPAPMRHTVLLASLALPLVLAAASRESRACQPPPADLIGLSTSFPADGATGVAVDSGIVLFGSVIIAAGNDFSDQLAVESLELVDAEGQPVPGEAVPWRSGQGEFELAWAPEAPLASESTYTLNATIRRIYAVDEYTEEELARGATLAATFTTGSATTAPLTAGALGLRTTEIVVDIKECPNPGDCGITCVVVDRLTYPQLEITVPDIDGGNDAAGYSAYFAVSAGSPLPFTGIGAPQETDATPLVELSQQAIASDGPSEVSIPLYVSDTAPFVPCVSAIVWDPSGKSVVLESVCAAQAVVPPLTHGEGGAGGTSGSAGSAGAPPTTGGVSATGGSSGDDGSAGAKPEKGGSGSGGYVTATGGSAGEDAAGGAVSTSGGDGTGEAPASGGHGTGGDAPASGGNSDDSPDSGGRAADAGRAGSTVEPPPVDESSGAHEQGGCSGCRTSRTPISPLSPLAALAAVLLAGARRRRRTP